MSSETIGLPVWKNGDMANGPCEEWLSEMTGMGAVLSVEPLVDSGGMNSDILRVRLERGSAIFKQLSAPDRRRTSLLLGLCREAHFYNSQELSGDPLIHELLPSVFHASADLSSGARFLLLEDLYSSDYLQMGLLCGPGNPNNWHRRDSGALSALEQRLCITPEKLASVISSAFRCSARLHGRFWRSPLLSSIPWLRSASWWPSSDPSSSAVSGSDHPKQWADAMEEALLRWTAFRALPAEQIDAEVWPSRLVALLDASFAKCSYEAYMQMAAAMPFTLVHGDFHPANLMWSDSLQTVKMLDWEMVGIGSGPQELGQFVISHLEPSFRAAHEAAFLADYHAQLAAVCPAVASSYSLNDCRAEYVAGGLGRWFWFLGWMSTSMPAPILRFFNSQVLAFADHHQVTPEAVSMPRI